MKNIWAKIGGAAAAVALCIILIQGGAAKNLEHYQCGMEEHTHDISCYGFISICGQEESEGHSHGASCYDTSEERVCGADGDEGHEHTDSCLKTQEVLTCAISEEKRHTHTSVCEREGLICGYSEHAHIDSCIAPEEPSETEGPEESEAAEITMEDFLENFTTGCYAFGNVIAPPARGTPVKAAGDTWDLKNFVTGIIIKNKDGVPVTSGEFFSGTDYTINITFAERTGLNGQFAYNMSGKLVYQFPEQVAIKQALNNVTLNGPNGKKIGTYSVNTSGRMEIWFGNFDNEGNTITQNFIDYYTNTTVRMDVKGQLKQNTGQTAVDFGLDTMVDMTISAPPAGVTVKKTGEAFDKANETLNYTVEITAVGGGLTDIALTDTLYIYNPAKSGDGFRVEAGDIPDKYDNPYGDVTYKINNGAAVNAGIAPTGSDMKLDLSGITLSEGAVIKVEYKLSLKGVFDHIASLSGTDTWFHRAQYDMRIENTATATGVNVDQPGQIATGSGKFRSSAANGMMTKTGSFIKDTDRIEWTARVGNGSTALGGMKITDVLKNSQSIAGDIKLNIWDKPPVNGTWGAPTHTATTATSIDGMTVDKNANGGFILNVPDNLVGAGPVYRIDFIYQTSQANNYAVQGNYENDISTTINGYTSTTTGRVNVSRNDKAVIFEKRSAFIYGANGSVTGIEYTVLYTIRAGHKGAKFQLLDEFNMPTITGTSVGKTPLRNQPDNLKGTIEPADPNFKYYVTPSNLSTNTTNRFTIYPYGTSAEPVAWPHDDQRTVIFTYTILINNIKHVNVTSLTPQYWLGYTRGLVNQPGATIEVTDGIVDTVFEAGIHDYINIIKKSGVQNKDDQAVFDYKVELNGAKPEDAAYRDFGYQGYPLFTDGQPAIFEDTFDKKLEYVPGSLYVVREKETRTLEAGDDIVRLAYYGPYDAESKADQVRIIGNTMRVDFRDMCNIGTWGGSVAQSTGFAAADSTDITSNLYKYWYSYYLNDHALRYTVYYQLRLKNDFTGYQGAGSPSTLKMANTARVYPTYPKFAGGKWESRVNVDYTPPKAVTKTMNVSGNIAKTEIIINPNESRLRPLNVINPRFTAVDVMSDTMALYQGSIKIYTKGDDGEWNTTAEAPQPDGLWGVNFISGQEMHFGFTDERAIKITYDALILKPAGQSVSLNNKITVYGETTGESKNNFTVQSSATVTEGSKSGLLLYKRDEDTGVSLPGAKFDIYMALKGNDAYDGVQTEHITVNGAKFYFVEEVDDAGKTGKGSYKFDSNWIRRDANPANNGAYLVRETRSPNDDYICPDPDDPANYMYFVLDPAGKVYWEGILKKAVHVLSDNYFLTNKNTLGGTAISGEKRLTGTIPANQSMTFGFALTQVDSDGSPYSGTAPAVLPEPLYVSVPMSTGTSGAYTPAQFVFNKLSNLKNGDYYFMAEEVNSPLAWLAMTAPQIVRVNVFAGEVTLHYPNNDSKFIFQNKYKNPTAAYADVSIPVNKKVDSEEFDHTFKFTFEIEQVVKDTAKGGYKPGESNGYKVPAASKSIGITGDGMGVFILENLPAPKTSPAGTVLTYYFRIKELDGAGGEWQYDPAKHIVRAEVTFDNDRGGQAKLTLLGDDSWVAFDALTFTNSLKVGGPKLPETGGIGRIIFTIGGSILMAGALAAMHFRRFLCKMGKTLKVH